MIIHNSDNFAQAEKVAERILHRLDEGQVRLQKIQNNRILISSNGKDIFSPSRLLGASCLGWWGGGWQGRRGGGTRPRSATSPSSSA